MSPDVGYSNMGRSASIDVPRLDISDDASDSMQCPSGEATPMPSTSPQRSTTENQAMPPNDSLPPSLSSLLQQQASDAATQRKHE